MAKSFNKSCYLSYSNMVIFPFSSELSWVGTCVRNMHKRPHKVISKKPLRQLWNDRRFQAQRELAKSKQAVNCLMGSGCLEYRKSCLNQELDFCGQKARSNSPTMNKDAFYLPLSIIVAFSTKCMNNCYHCLNSANRKEIELSNSHKKELIEVFFPRADYIEFTGGEPLFSNAKDILHVFKTYPGKKYRLSTNGILLKKIDFSVVPINTKFIVSLYGFDQKSYYEITGTDNFDQVYNALVDLIDQGHGNKIFLKYVVYRDSLSVLDRFCNFVKANPSLGKATIVSDVAAGFSVYPVMQKMQKIYGDEEFEWLYAGSSLKDAIANHLPDPFYYFSWQLALWRSRFMASVLI